MHLLHTLYMFIRRDLIICIKLPGKQHLWVCKRTKLFIVVVCLFFCFCQWRKAVLRDEKMHTHSKHTERRTLYKTDKDLRVQKSSLPSGAGFDVLREQGCFISLFRSLKGILPRPHCYKCCRQASQSISWVSYRHRKRPIKAFVLNHQAFVSDQESDLPIQRTDFHLMRK